MSDTFAAKLEDYPSTEGFHENDYYVDYTEDIYVGYRYFETIPGAAKKVNYPFGFGLSYTTFLLENCKAEEFVVKGENDGLPDAIVASATVTNIGHLPGKEVVQLYYSAPQGKLGKPARVLAGYCKTRLLQPGESQRITIALYMEDMASYDDLGKVKKAAWVLEKGEYRFYLGTSVRDVTELDYKYVLNKNVVTEQLSNKLVPTSLKKRMLSDGTFEELPQKEPVDTYASIFPREKNFMVNIGWKVLKSPKVRPVDMKQLFLPEEEGVPKKFTEVAECRISMEDFIAQLDNEQLAALLGGCPNKGMANTFGYGGLTEMGVPAAMTADGPAGVRIAPGVGVTTTAFPCSTLLACTWNEDVCYEVGAAGGAEAKECNFAVWLTPAVNIHRSPLCGRNFEYYSEDGVLAGWMCANAVNGAREWGVYSYVKHFATNDQETNRTNFLCTWLNEQSLREIYLKSFEITFKNSNPGATMVAFNNIGTIPAEACSELLNTVLRGEWGFRGFAETDYFGGYGYQDADRMIRNGCDLMLATYSTPQSTVTDQTSATSVIAMRQASKNILYTVVNSRAYDKEVSTGLPTWQKILYAIDVILVLLLACLEFLVIKKYLAKKKELEPQVESTL